MCTFDFDCFDVGFWLVGRSDFVGWKLDFGCVEIRFWLCLRWILVGRTLEFGCWTYDFGLVDVGF